mmetsp:Transcript_546/g.1813  ORF Transcript_546/g.1813 Transcript_546/m.1813 type:complete len:214 (-) Transcript_546:1865-2506(-)
MMRGRDPSNIAIPRETRIGRTTSSIMRIMAVSTLRARTPSSIRDSGSEGCLPLSSDNRNERILVCRSPSSMCVLKTLRSNTAGLSRDSDPLVQPRAKSSAHAVAISVAAFATPSKALCLRSNLSSCSLRCSSSLARLPPASSSRASLTACGSLLFSLRRASNCAAAGLMPRSKSDTYAAVMRRGGKVDERRMSSNVFRAVRSSEAAKPFMSSR